MAILKGPQAMMAIHLGVGHRLPHAKHTSVRVNERDRRRVLKEWVKARRNGNGKPARRPAQVTAQEAEALVIPVPRRLKLPPLEALPNEYLAACVREARHRIVVEQERAKGIGLLQEALA